MNFYPLIPHNYSIFINHCSFTNIISKWFHCDIKFQTPASVQVPRAYMALAQIRWLTRTHVNAKLDIPEQTVILVK